MFAQNPKVSGWIEANSRRSCRSPGTSNENVPICHGCKCLSRLRPKIHAPSTVNKRDPNTGILEGIAATMTMTNAMMIVGSANASLGCPNSLIFLIEHFSSRIGADSQPVPMFGSRFV
jgi:hypothetical protein